MSYNLEINVKCKVVKAFVQELQILDCCSFEFTAELHEVFFDRYSLGLTWAEARVAN